MYFLNLYIYTKFLFSEIQLSFAEGSCSIWIICENCLNLNLWFLKMII